MIHEFIKKMKQNIRWRKTDMNYRDREVNWLTISYLMEVVFYSASSEKTRVWFQAC